MAERGPSAFTGDEMHSKNASVAGKKWKSQGRYIFWGNLTGSRIGELQQTADNDFKQEAAPGPR